MTCTVLADDWRRISRVTVGTPFKCATERCSFVPSSTRPMSRILTGEPLIFAITSSSIWRGSVKRPRVRSTSSRFAGLDDCLPAHRRSGAPEHCARLVMGILYAAQPFSVDPDIDRALKSADHVHLAHTAGPLELRGEQSCPPYSVSSRIDRLP